VAVTEGLVREEQLLHDMCLLGAMKVEITQILTRAGTKYVWTPLRQNPVLSCDEVSLNSLEKNNNKSPLNFFSFSFVNGSCSFK